MHIAFTTFEFPTENIYGGLGSYLANISTIMGEAGHKVTVFVLSDRMLDIQWKENVRVIRVKKYKGRVVHEILLNSKKKDRREVAKLLDLSYAFKLRIEEENRINPIDIVQHFADWGFSFYRIKGVPSVARISSFPAYWRRANVAEFEMHISYKDLTAREKHILHAIRRADAVYAPSNIIANVTERFIHKKVEVIESPFYMDYEIFDESIYKKLLGDTKYLLFYGKVSYLKGAHIIAEIIYDFLDRYKEYSFVLVGRDYDMVIDSEKTTMSKYIIMKAKEHGGRVKYISEIGKKEQLIPIIKNAEGCVLPSRIDNLPNTCIEAMALGKVVIGTNGASFEQLIQDKINGLLIERDKPESLLKAINYFFAMKEEERYRMEREAYQTVQRMQPKFVREKLEGFYSYIIDKKNRLQRQKD